MIRIFLGNLPRAASELDLHQWLTEHKYKVGTTQVIRDQATGQARGFGFAEIDVPPNEGQEVIRHLNNKPMKLAGPARNITVNMATPKQRYRNGPLTDENQDPRR